MGQGCGHGEDARADDWESQAAVTDGRAALTGVDQVYDAADPAGLAGDADILAAATVPASGT